MQNIQKKGWATCGILLLTLLLNIVIMKASHNNQNVLWGLVVSIPVLIMVMYRAWRTSRLLLYFTNSAGPIAQRPHVGLLPQPTYPAKIAEADLQVLIGNDQCRKPYNACLLSIGAIGNTNREPSFLQALSGNETDNLELVNEGLTSCDLAVEGPVWQIDPTYQGCRTENGNLDLQAFKKIASTPDVKMIEIRLTSPGNLYYTAGLTLDIANSNETKTQHSIFQGSRYTAFQNAEGLVHFIESLRELSAGKPIGIRLSIIDKKEFHQICCAIRKTQINPDFIVVEGAPDRPGFSHPGVLFYPEMPLYEALLFVSQTLQSYALDKVINVIAAGKICSGLDVLKLLALGANSVRAEITESDLKEYGGIAEARFEYWNKDLQHRLMKDIAEVMNIGGFRSLEDVTLPKYLCSLEALYSKGYRQPGDEALYTGSIIKMYSGKANRLESRGNKSKESRLLQ